MRFRIVHVLVALGLSGCIAREADDSEPLIPTPSISVTKTPRKTSDARTLELIFADLPTFPDDGSHELHLVIVNEGIAEDKQAGEERASVFVQRPGKSVVLFLGASNSNRIAWQVDIAEDTRLAAVILGGTGTHTLTGVPKDVPVIDGTHDDEKRALWGRTQLRRRDGRRILVKLSEGTGLPASSHFGGSVRHVPDGTIRVTRVDDNPELDMDYPRVDADDIPDLEYAAVNYRPRQRATLGMWSLRNGPLAETQFPAPVDCEFYTFDPRTREWFGRRNGVSRLVRGQESVHPLTTSPENLKRGSRGLTVNVAGQQLITTSGQDILTCPLDDPAWTAVGTLDRVPGTAMCYRSADDPLYTLHARNDGKGLDTFWLASFTTQGSLISNRQITGSFYNGMERGIHGGTHEKVQLISVEDHLVLVVHCRGYVSTDAGPAWQPVVYTFLVNPDDATARLTWKHPSSRHPAD